MQRQVNYVAVSLAVVISLVSKRDLHAVECSEEIEIGNNCKENYRHSYFMALLIKKQQQIRGWAPKQ